MKTRISIYNTSQTCRICEQVVIVSPFNRSTCALWEWTTMCFTSPLRLRCCDLLWLTVSSLLLMNGSPIFHDATWGDFWIRWMQINKAKENQNIQRVGDLPEAFGWNWWGCLKRKKSKVVIEHNLKAWKIKAVYFVSCSSWWQRNHWFSIC